MKNFVLWFGCLGNGTTVCNKAVEEHGDYKKIAHISEGGNIHFYVKESYIPASEMEKIKETAKRDKEKFIEQFESLPEGKQYEKILDKVNLQKFMEITKDKRPLKEKLPEIRKYYYTIS